MSQPSPRADAALRAFTLIELLTVMAIVAVLTSILIGVGHHAHERSRIARARTEVAALAAALEKYRLKYGDYPQTDDPALFLQALIGRRGPLGSPIVDCALFEVGRFSTEAALDPFDRSDAVLVDPWAKPYAYHYLGANQGVQPAFVLFSSGADQLSAPYISQAPVDSSAPENVDNLYANR